MGKNLSPGERAINWAKALGIICTALVGLVGYQNKDKLAGWAGYETATDVDVVIDGGPEEQLIHSIETIVNKLKEHEGELGRLSQALAGESAKRKSEVNRLNTKIEKWHDE
jgi:hypothetical protein